MFIQAKCFPCMEAPRGYLTFEDGGLRLRCQRNGRVVTTTTARAACEQRDVWNVQSDGTVMSSDRVLCYNVAYHMVHVMEAATETNRACRLRVVATKEGDRYQLVTAEGQVMAVQKGQLVAVAASTETASSLLRLDRLHGELCYLTNAQYDQRICCDLLGRLTAVDNRTGGWEIWRLVESGAGAVQIRSWTHAHRCLTSNADGRVYTVNTTTTNAHDWIPVGANPHGVVLRSVAHGRVLCMTNEGSFCTVAAAETPTSLACRWTFTPAHRNRFRLVAGGRHAVAACVLEATTTTDTKESTTPPLAVTTVPTRPEHALATLVQQQLALDSTTTTSTGWTVTCVDEDFVTLHQRVRITTHTTDDASYTEQTVYLSNDDTGGVRTSPQPHLWTLEHTKQKSVTLRSLYGQRLCCNPEGDLSLQSTDDDDTNSDALPWTLVPCLPLAPSGRHVWSLAGAVGMAVVAPLVVVEATAALAVLGLGGATWASLRRTPHAASCAATVWNDDEADDDDDGPMVRHRPFVAWQEWSA